MVVSKLVKRVRRQLMGGRYDMRIYDDGHIRARFDHLSNDPEIEMAMGGRLLKVARAVFAEHGLPEPILGPVTWRDDP